MDFVSAGKNALLLYMTVCEKLVTWLDKYDDVIEWNFMRIDPPEMKSWLRPCFQVKLKINLCARISSALHRCLRETRVEELVCFSFSEGCVKTIWSSRSESCVLTYPFACALATLRIMLNIAVISHDLIFSRYQLSRFFWDFVSSDDFVWNKAISLVIREQALHIKIGRIFIKRAKAYVESFCRRYAKKQVITNACSIATH